MDGDLFYVLGGILVLSALAIAFVGIRGADSFPPSRGVLAGVIAVFALIVGTTMAFAIDLSEEEQSHREHELAMEEQEAQAEAQTEGEAATPRQPGGQPQASEATTLAVTSPEDGSLVFDPDGLETQPGGIAITYANPSPVPHSLAVESDDGTLLGETSVFANSEESVALPDLGPGEYIYFCTVPGHREAGMEGRPDRQGGHAAGLSPAV